MTAEVVPVEFLQCCDLAEHVAIVLPVHLLQEGLNGATSRRNHGRAVCLDLNIELDAEGEDAALKIALQQYEDGGLLRWRRLVRRCLHQRFVVRIDVFTGPQFQGLDRCGLSRCGTRRHAFSNRQEGRAFGPAPVHRARRPGDLGKAVRAQGIAEAARIHADRPNEGGGNAVQVRARIAWNLNGGRRQADALHDAHGRHDETGSGVNGWCFSG